MVLVDTSVWIRYLVGKSPYARELDRLLAQEEVLVHDFVLGELLIGDRGGRRLLLSSLERIGRATPVPHREVIDFVQARRLHGRGLGWIDAHLLASALVERIVLWTADAALAAAASDLGVGYNG
jgi:predicted nucleic acid-binding protein